MQANNTRKLPGKETSTMPKFADIGATTESDSKFETAPSNTYLCLFLGAFPDQRNVFANGVPTQDREPCLSFWFCTIRKADTMQEGKDEEGNPLPFYFKLQTSLYFNAASDKNRLTRMMDAFHGNRRITTQEFESLDTDDFTKKFWNVQVDEETNKEGTRTYNKIVVGTNGKVFIQECKTPYKEFASELRPDWRTREIPDFVKGIRKPAPQQQNPNSNRPGFDEAVRNLRKDQPSKSAAPVTDDDDPFADNGNDPAPVQNPRNTPRPPEREVDKFPADFDDFSDPFAE